MRQEWRTTDPIPDEVLGSYLDHELERDRRMEVEAYLAANPDAAEFVGKGERLRMALHRLFDRPLTHPLPPAQEALARELGRRMARGERLQSYRRLAVAAVALVVIFGAGALGWRYMADEQSGEGLFALFPPGAPQERLAADGTPSRAEEVMPRVALAIAEGQGAGVEGQTTAADAAHARRGAPDFETFGFDLIGARLLARDDGQSMQLVYEASSGARVELFFSPVSESSRRSLTLMEEGPISVLFWHNAGHSYSLIGEVGRDTLLEMGKVVNGEWTVELPGTGLSGGASGSVSDRDGDSGTGKGREAETVPSERNNAPDERTGDSEPSDTQT